jgi:phosphoribosylamine--glycine ligase
LDAPQPRNIKVFHAGTTTKENKTVTSGGRVLCVTALADTISTAQQNCYEAARKIHWDGVTLRKDIAWRAIAREKVEP